MSGGYKVTLHHILSLDTRRKSKKKRIIYSKQSGGAVWELEQLKAYKSPHTQINELSVEFPIAATNTCIHP